MNLLPELQKRFPTLGEGVCRLALAIILYAVAEAVADLLAKRSPLWLVKTLLLQPGGSWGQAVICD